MTVLSGATPEQVNYYIPNYLPLETYLIKAYSESGAFIGTGATRINNISPGIFYTTGNLTVGFLFRYNRNTGNYVYDLLVPTGNTWNPNTEDAYLILFGTGIRRATTFSSQVGGINHSVPYAGAGSSGPGSDQVNIGPLSTSLLGSGQKTIRFFAGGLEANQTQCKFQ